MKALILLLLLLIPVNHSKEFRFKGVYLGEKITSESPVLDFQASDEDYEKMHRFSTGSKRLDESIRDLVFSSERSKLYRKDRGDEKVYYLTDVNLQNRVTRVFSMKEFSQLERAEDFAYKSLMAIQRKMGSLQIEISKTKKHIFINVLPGEENYEDESEPNQDIHRIEPGMTPGDIPNQRGHNSLPPGHGDDTTFSSDEGSVVPSHPGSPSGANTKEILTKGPYTQPIARAEHPPPGKTPDSSIVDPEPQPGAGGRFSGGHPGMAPDPGKSEGGFVSGHPGMAVPGNGGGMEPIPVPGVSEPYNPDGEVPPEDYPGDMGELDGPCLARVSLGSLQTELCVEEIRIVLFKTKEQGGYHVSFHLNSYSNGDDDF